MSNPINAPLLGTDSSGNLIPVTPSPALLAITGSPGTQSLGLEAGANLGLASAAVPLATLDAAGNATIALQQWQAASRHGQLVPLAFVENNNSSTCNTANVFASDARAVAAGATPGHYTVNQTAIAQAALNYSCATGYGIDFGRDILVCTASLNYPTTPPYPAYFVADGGGLLRQFDSFGTLAIVTSGYNAALIQNMLVSETTNVSGPIMRGMLLGTSYTFMQHFLTGKKTGDRRNRWAVQIGDWSGMNAPALYQINPNSLPVAGTNVINLLNFPMSAMGGCLINRRFISWGAMITNITAAHGGFDVTLAPWIMPGVTATAIAAAIPPLWQSSAWQTQPAAPGNVIYTDTLPPGYPADFFIGSPLDMPPNAMGTPYVVANSIVRSIGPNTNGAPQATGSWAESTTYTAGQVITNLGNVYKMTAATSGMSAGPPSIGPYGTGSAIADNTCTWKYLGPNGYIVTLQPPSGVSNAVTLTVDPNAPLNWPPEVILATGTCTYPTPNYQNSTMGSPASVNFLPREWQGAALVMKANYTRLDDCEITGVAGANAVELLGSGNVLNDLNINATSGTNGRVYALGNSGGVLCAGGELTLVNPNITSGDDCIAIGPMRSMVGTALAPLTNIPIGNVTIVNPTLVSYQARSIAAFLVTDQSQQQNPWNTYSGSPPQSNTNTLTFQVLPVPGYTTANLQGKAIANSVYLQIGTTITTVTSGSFYVANLNQNVKATGVPGKSYQMQVQTIEPLQTLTSGINVYIKGGIGLSLGDGDGVGILNTNSSGEIVLDIDGYVIDMSYNISPKSTGFSSLSTFPSTIRMRGCRVMRPPAQAVALSGSHNYVDLDGNVFDTSSGSVASANVQLWGISAGRIVGNRFGGAATGNNVSVGGQPGSDNVVQVLGNSVANLDFGANTYFGIANGGLGIDVAHATNVTFDGWSSFTQAAPIGTGSGVSALRIDQGTSTGIFYDKLRFYVDGIPVVYIAGSGTFTTGFNFVPNAGGQLPTIALSAVLTTQTSNAALLTLDALGAPTPGTIGVSTMSGTHFYVRG